MRLSFLLILTNLLVFYSYPQISNCNFSSVSGNYMKFEINFNLPTYSNPYDPSIIDCYALFISPSGKTYKQNGYIKNIQ